MGRLKEYSILTVIVLTLLLFYGPMSRILIIVPLIFFVLLSFGIYFSKRGKLEAILVPSISYVFLNLLSYPTAGIFSHLGLRQWTNELIITSWALAFYFFPGAILSFVLTPFIMDRFRKKGNEKKGIIVSVGLSIILILLSGIIIAYPLTRIYNLL